jgi:hypothetical protein
MVLLGLPDKVKEVEIGLVRVDGTAAQDVVAAAERGTDAGHAETGHWFYSVPFPGVRYYDYEELLL